MEAADAEKLQESKDDGFVWDDTAQLYVHHSSGFYHDPNAGWYYGSRDGTYYKYENGEYTPLEFDPSHVSSPRGGEIDKDNMYVDEGQIQKGTTDPGEDYSAATGCPSDKRPDDDDDDDRPRPSTWVEDTLISLYLLGYDQRPQLSMSHGADDQNGKELSANGDSDDEELEEGEWIPEDDFDPCFSMEEEECGHSMEEELWKAQYGQVVENPEKALPNIAAVDLWDWKVIGEPSRLVGRLVRQSAKLHPSVAPGGKLLKTAPICEAQLHLVRVRTGQVYRLRNPSAKYVASLSAYDSSNPTKGWGFPEISQAWQNRKVKKMTKCNRGGVMNMNSQDELNTAEERSHAYRDRAAERRNLHGGYGVGPGQKRSDAFEGDEEELPETASAAEALEMAFGSQSYGRRIMGNMGWKEGERLGKSMKGLLQPIEAVGNTGSVGLGYPQGRPAKHNVSI